MQIRQTISLSQCHHKLWTSSPTKSERTINAKILHLSDSAWACGQAPKNIRWRWLSIIGKPAQTTSCCRPAVKLLMSNKPSLNPFSTQTYITWRSDHLRLVGERCHTQFRSLSMGRRPTTSTRMTTTTTLTAIEIMERQFSVFQIQKRLWFLGN